ncbi:MAG: hypothetical protein Q8R28_06580 [Dehalococcoidia bacterium]|nr:hypothetical protein [Dehalococcoidia bacterium]
MQYRNDLKAAEWRVSSYEDRDATEPTWAPGMQLQQTVALLAVAERLERLVAAVEDIGATLRRVEGVLEDVTRRR